VGTLEARLRAARDAGRKSFVPYVTGGYPGVDGGLLEALAATGADAIEVGIPHSDPIMDGGVIQQASADALREGATVGSVLEAVQGSGVEVPVAVMTYANVVVHRGVEAFVEAIAGAGVRGAIVPDLPVDEAGEIARVAQERDVDVVLLAAPGTRQERLQRIAEASHGFLYCVATYGVTGARDRLEGTAAEVVDALRALTDLPLLVGVGIGTPAAAAEACAFADGVVVGSALMSALIDEGPDGLLALATAFRAAIA
jgi:tryptophan synthase alpha chain